MEKLGKRILFSLGALSFATAISISSQQAQAEDSTKTPWNNWGNGHMNGGGPGMMSSWHMGQGMMGAGGMCPFGFHDAKVEVKENRDGVVITLTGKNKDEIRRIQKMVQIMKLQHELETE